MRLGAERFRQRPEDVLPFQQAVGEEVHAGGFLRANEAGQIIGEGGLDGIRADAAAIESSRGGDDFLGARIDTVLIREDVNVWSLPDGLRSSVGATQVDRIPARLP
jgi:hypothetical protein